MSTEKNKWAGWKFKLFGTLNMGKRTVWHNEIATSPQGQEYIGFHRYDVDAKGKETRTQDGFMLINDGTGGGRLSNIISLLTSMNGSKHVAWDTKKAAVRVAEPKSVKKSARKEVEEFFLVNRGGFLYVDHRQVGGVITKVKRTDEPNEARSFSTREQGLKQIKAMRKDGVVSTWVVRNRKEL